MNWSRPYARARLSGAAALAACLAVVCPAPAAAVSIELKDVAPDRIERQRAAEEGALPLPGTPDPSSFKERLSEKGLKPGAQVFIRVFKAESELEVWMRKGDEFVLVSTYPVCHWSGTIGPKVKEGDKQTPEGFYSVQRRQLHRSGRWPQALNLGFPNLYDRAQSRTGSYLLVHGGCSSIGCFAMTNTVIEEIFELTNAALKEGQSEVPVHVFPFRMTQANLEAHRNSEWIEFWKGLKQGYDSFERTRRPPTVLVCEKRYMVIDAAPGAPEQQPGLIRRVVNRLAPLSAAEQTCPAPPPTLIPTSTTAPPDATGSAPAPDVPAAGAAAPPAPPGGAGAAQGGAEQKAQTGKKPARAPQQAGRAGSGARAATVDPATVPGANVNTMFTEAR